MKSLVEKCPVMHSFVSEFLENQEYSTLIDSSCARKNMQFGGLCSGDPSAQKLKLNILTANKPNTNFRLVWQPQFSSLASRVFL